MRALVLILLLLLLCWSSALGGKGPGGLPPCSSDSDCASVCNAGVCRKVCSSDAECKDTCTTGGYCSPPPDGGLKCSGNSDCPTCNTSSNRCEVPDR